MQLASEYHWESYNLSGFRSYLAHEIVAVYHRLLASFPKAIKMPTVIIKLVTGCMF